MLFITCPQETVSLLVQELTALGVTGARSGFAGVFAEQTMRNVYLINYRSRLATRVLWPLSQFKCPHKEVLYSQAKKIPWSKYLTLKQTFAIDANVSHPNLKNSLFAALVVKDAICDQFREKTGERPSVETQNPDVQFNLFIHQQTATLYLDTSGAPLYKRGYRQETGPAPIQESLAAAILFLASYRKSDILCDPFCGSGTFLIEAAMIASQTPAGFFRKQWGFLYHPEFSSKQWEEIKQEADQLRQPLEKGKLMGADSDARTIKALRSVLKMLGFQEAIEIEWTDIQGYRPLSPTLLVTNPPYGKRLEAFRTTYRTLGEFIKQRSSSLKRSFVLTSESSLAKAVGLPIIRSTPLKNGGIPVMLYHF